MQCTKLHIPTKYTKKTGRKISHFLTDFFPILPKSDPQAETALKQISRTTINAHAVYPIKLHPGCKFINFSATAMITGMDTTHKIVEWQIRPVAFL